MPGSEPVSAERRPRTDSPSLPPLSRAPSPVSADQAQATRRRAIQARENALRAIQAQQRLAANALGSNNGTEAPPAVTPATLARMRALILLGPITVAAETAPAEPAGERTGVPDFDEEAAIAARNARAMQPYLIAACDRLVELASPPATQEECDQLREQLDLYHQQPETYDIRTPDGNRADLPLQAYRAYAEALSQGLPMHLPRGVPAGLALDLREHGLSLDRAGAMAAQISAVASRGFDTEYLAAAALHPNGHIVLEALATWTPALRAHGFSDDYITFAAVHPDGSLNLKAMNDWAPALRTLSLSFDCITAAASSPGNARNLQGLAQWTPELRGLGFSDDQIAAAAAQQDGHLNLETMARCTPDIHRVLGLSLAEIAQHASRPTGRLLLTNMAHMARNPPN